MSPKINEVPKNEDTSPKIPEIKGIELNDI